MAFTTHLLLSAAYVVLALVIALVLPEVGFDQNASRIGALVILQLGIGVHLLIVRARDRDLAHQRMVALEQDLRDMADVFEQTSQEVEELKKLDSQRAGGHEEVVQEMRVLQTLLDQVVKQGGARPATHETDGESRPSGGQDVVPLQGDDTLRPEDFLRIVENALNDNRVDLYLQPIVALPNRRPLHYECFSRVRDESGSIIFPRHFIPVVERSGMVGTLDNLLLFRCIQLIRRLGDRRKNTRFFCNISSQSLHDQQFFPQFIDYMLANRNLASRLIFEFAYDDMVSMDPKIVERLKILGSRGYRFSVDHIETRSVDIVGLADRFVSWVKIDGNVLRSVSGDLHPADFKEALKRHEISLIASKVEEETTVLDILDLNVDYAQGFLFGEPRLSREEPRTASDEVI